MKKLWTIIVAYLVTLFQEALADYRLNPERGDLSGGHWKNLGEAQKLTQPYQLPGVVETDIKRNNPTDFFPLAQANHSGERIDWLRENTTTEDAVSNLGIGGQTILSEDIEYTEKNTTLRIKYMYRKLDKFIPHIYGTFNNYEEIKLKECVKGVRRKVGHAMIYDDYTYDTNSLEFDGLHAWAAESWGEDWDIDEGEGALSLANWRKLYYAMKHGVDFWLIPYTLQRHLDAAYQEVGFTQLKADTAGTMGGITWGQDEGGKPITKFMNAPLIPTDYLGLETVNTGQGSDARASNLTSGTMYSLFGVKLGSAGLMEADPGCKMAFGKTETNGEFFDLEYFEKLEGYKAKAIRLSTYVAMILGSPMAIGRITDFTDAAITA